MQDSIPSQHGPPKLQRAQQQVWGKGRCGDTLCVYKRVSVFVLSVGERLEGFLCVTVCLF